MTLVELLHGNGFVWQSGSNIGDGAQKNTLCCELTVTHNVIKEGAPFRQTLILPVAQLCNKNIGSYLRPVDSLTVRIKNTTQNIVLLFSLRQHSTIYKLFEIQVAMVLSETGSTVRILRLAQKFRNYERSITVWRSVCGILHQVIIFEQVSVRGVELFRWSNHKKFEFN